MGKAFLCVIGALLISGSATAAPITYDFTSGSMTITGVTSDSGTTIITPTLVPLDGVFVTFDATTIDLSDLLLTVPTTVNLGVTGAWGLYDSYQIESASISPALGYSTVFGAQTGPGTFIFAAGPLAIDGIFNAYDSTLATPDLIGAPFPFTDSSFISGSIDLNTGTLTLTGLTLAVIPGALFGEIENLEIKADITFVGMNPIPEPSTALLVGLGLVGLASSRRGNILN